MKNEKRRKMYFITGALCTAANTFMQHYLKLPDFVFGVFFGISAGLIILSIINPGKAKPIC